MSNASIIRHSTAPTGDHQHANDVDEQHSQALFLRTTSPNSVLVAEPSDAASRSASSASSAAVVASSPPAAVPEVLSPASISAAPVMLPAFSWPRSPAQARQHATDLLQQHRREWSKPGWALFVRQVLMGLLSSNTPDLDALDTQLQSNEQTRCWLEQPFLRLLYEVTKAVMRVLNSNPVYPNTLAFPEQEVQQMVDSMLLVSYIASVDPTSSDEINGLRDYLLVPSRAILVQRCVAQLGPALRDEVRRSYPDLAQYVDLAIGQPVLTVGLFGPMVLPALVEALTADMQTSLPELAEMASNCAMVMRLVQRDLQLDMKRYAEARRVLALPEQGGGNEAVDDDADELVAVLKGTINAHQPQFGPARAPVRHVSENLSVSYVMCHAPLPTIPHELAEVDLRAESVVSVHVLQSATIDDEKAMQRMEGALKPLERHNQRWFNNNLALLPFTHVSLLCTGEFGNRYVVYPHSSWPTAEYADDSNSSHI